MVGSLTQLVQICEKLLGRSSVYILAVLHRRMGAIPSVRHLIAKLQAHDGALVGLTEPKSCGLCNTGNTL